MIVNFYHFTKKNRRKNTIISLEINIKHVKLIYFVIKGERYVENNEIRNLTNIQFRCYKG